MLLFIDTEYTDSLNCDLISIGMVSEDKRYEIYLERSDFQVNWCNSFVHASVIPQLGQFGYAMSRRELSDKLKFWFASLPRQVYIACDSYTDWELMLDAMDNTKPQNLVGRFDLRSLVDSSVYHNEVVRYHELYGAWHHALHDARAHRYGWLAWNDREKARRAALKGCGTSEKR